MKTAIVLLATTDRPEPFASLAADLVGAAARAAVPVTLGIVENSRLASSRASNLDTVRRLEAGEIEVVVSDAWPGGHNIGDARTRQRDLLRSLIGRGRRPAFVWMLDDDLRFARAVVREGLLTQEPLGDPLGVLMALSHRPGRPDVLVGTVHGDPPIPAMATWASRVSDLATNLERMMALGPDSRWPSDANTARRLSEPDYYYDYGHHPAHEEPAFWLPRHRGQTTSTALGELLAEARHLPCGVGFTRPLVASVDRPTDLAKDGPSLLGAAQVRGGNTVFFDLDACLAHHYPTVQVGGVTTRRSDSVGMYALRASRGVRIVASDFALLHSRDREPSRLPDAEELERHFVADTLGAALTRAIDGADAEALAAFLRARVLRVDRSLSRLQTAIARVRNRAIEAPRWVDEAGLRALAVDPDGALAWFVSNVPGLAEGRLPDAVRSRLLAPSVVAELSQFAGSCVASMQPKQLEHTL